MKKTLITSFIVVLSALLFSYTISGDNLVYPDYISVEMKKTLDEDFIKTINKVELNEHLAKNFVRYFDEVSAVRAQYSEEIGYYYAVIGTKSGKSVIDFLKVNEIDVTNETYTYIDFSNIAVDASTEYCTFGGLNCPSGCNYNPNNLSCQAKCGIWTGIQCVSQ